MKFLIATNNPKKLLELKNILLPLGIEAVSAKQENIDIGEIEETGSTFEDNAQLKAEAGLKISGIPTIADDSGLVVDALNGEPGIYSSRYSGENATDDQNIEKLLDKLKDIPIEKRTAKFVCAICCAFPNGEKIFVRGECKGKIGFCKKGNFGFGYDPVFLIDNGKSFAQLTSEEKNKISHRGKALILLSEELRKKLNK